MQPDPDEMSNSQQDQYNAAFDEEREAPATQSDDDAFGITPPEEAVAAAEVEGSHAEPAADEMASDAAAAPTNAVQNPEPDAKEIQRIKTHDGRMRKIESDREAQAAQAAPEATETLEAVSEQAEAKGNEALGEAAESAAEQVESGALSVSQAMKQLSEDFGEDFVRMIEAIASAKANEIGGQAASSVRGEVDSIISHIQDGAEKAHFKAISAACPDFNEVRQDPGFLSFVAANPSLQQVAQGGSADEVIGLIKQFQAQATPAAPATSPAAPAKPKPAADQPDPEGVDAAAGVRSGSLRLPSPPEESDYESAFEEASRSK